MLRRSISWKHFNRKHFPCIFFVHLFDSFASYISNSRNFIEYPGIDQTSINRKRSDAFVANFPFCFWFSFVWKTQSQITRQFDSHFVQIGIEMMRRRQIQTHTYTHTHIHIEIHWIFDLVSFDYEYAKISIVYLFPLLCLHVVAFGSFCFRLYFVIVESLFLSKNKINTKHVHCSSSQVHSPSD